MALRRLVGRARSVVRRSLPDGASRPHYVVFRDVPIAYGRVPKAANSSIKRALTRYLPDGEAVRGDASPDLTWAYGTGGATYMLGTPDAAALEERFVFSFVRDPFSRTVSYYNDKVVGPSDLPTAAQRDGVGKGMGFADFLDRLAAMRDEDIDVHLLPQSTILVHEGRLVPSFVGRHETIVRDWRRLRKRLVRAGAPDPGPLPKRNRRAPDGHDLSAYFGDPGLRRLVRERYAADFERFYPDAEPLGEGA